MRALGDAWRHNFGMFDWGEHDAVLFDLDGVITPTAEVHERAWLELFAPFGATHDDYVLHIDGRPRYDGVRAFLASRGVTLPEGSPADPPGPGTVCSLGNEKDALFNAILARDGVAPYPGSLAVLDELQARSIPVAIVSSSRNARPVLTAAGLDDRFGVVVDGVVAADLGLPGKPAPDTFVHAAELLGVSPARAAVVEDALSGVAAAAAGGFGAVIGVDRGAGADSLAAAGADVVVTDLGDLAAPTGTSGGATR